MVLNDRNILKLCDFGFSRTITSFARTDNIGTPIYMAPEVFIRDRGYTEKCDIYSWALSFWYCLTGEIPFKECKTRKELKTKKLNSAMKFPDIPMISDLSHGMNQIIQNCVKFNPEDRPAMEKVVKDLENLLGYN